MNVERRNDKELDVLMLRLEVSQPAHRLGAGNPVEYHLRHLVRVTLGADEPASLTM